jgi:hypothetical protein
LKLWLVVVFLLLPSVAFAGFSVSGVANPASVSGVGTPAGVSGVGSAYATACATAEVLPTVDTTKGDWTPSTGTDHYAVVDELKASPGTGDYLTGYDTPGFAPDVLRFTLPGNCNVTAVTVWTYGSSGSESHTLTIDISKDNSTYTSTQDQAITTSETARSTAFTSLAWTNPAYVYVRFKLNSSSYNITNIFQLSVVVNP